MLQISKAQIEQAIKSLENAKEASATSLHYGVNRAQVALDISDAFASINMLQSLLEQEEAQPVACNEDSSKKLDQNVYFQDCAGTVPAIAADAGLSGKALNTKKPPKL